MAKIGNRVLGAAGIAILVSSLGVLAACGEQPVDENAAAKETVSNANVALTMYDENGVEVGHGTGIMIAPQTVLTAAHLVAGKGHWAISTADGKQKVNGVRGQTFDWKRYDSMNAHPRKHDVAVIFTDRPIKLASYPKIATNTQQNGEQVMRVRSEGKGFQFVDSSLERVRQMPNAYITSMPSSETLDTGGAVINGKGEIVGVVTGRGMQTGKLYVAKLGEVLGWLSDKASCGGASAANGGGALSIRTIGTPPPKDGCTKDAGAGGSSSGSSSGGGSSSGASGSGSSSGNGGPNGELTPGGGVEGSDAPKCEVGGGFEYPGGGGSLGVSSPVSNSGTNGATGPGSNPYGGAGSGDGSGAGGGSPTGVNGGSTNGTNGGSTNGGTGSGTGTGTGGGTNTGTNGGSTNGATTGGTTGGGAGGTGATGSGTGGGSYNGSNSNSSVSSPTGGGAGGVGNGTLDEEVCESELDNPDVCPPENFNCEGSACGGAFKPADNTIDYGDCGCKGESTGSSGPIILR